MTFGLRRLQILPRKKGLLLVGNPLCFVFLRMVAGGCNAPKTPLFFRSAMS